MQTIKMESKTYQYRKITKPLLERKRRARINKCLDNLKDLMMDCMRGQGDDNMARLEKADILELTVQHLRNIKHNTTKSVQIKPNMDNNNNSFRSGYVHAANEVSRALSTFSRVNIELGTTLMTHLGHRLNEIQQNEIILNKNNIGSAIKRGSSSSTLSVYCDSFSENFNNHSRTMISPSQSSGYGSDSEISSISLQNQHLDESANVWRPW